MLEIMRSLRLGTRIESAIKPIGRAARLACYGPDGKLKPESKCAKRRDLLDGKRKP